MSTPFFAQQGKKDGKIFVAGLPDAKVIVTKEAEEMMAEFTLQVPHEVSWMGTVTKDPKSWDLTIEQVFLLRQHGTAVHTVIEAESLAELVETNRDLDPEKLLFWGHTHPNFSVDGSKQDDDTMDMFKQGGHPWGLRGVFNKKGEANFSLFLFNGVHSGIDIFLHHMAWSVMGAEQEKRACADQVAEQIKLLVKKEETSAVFTSRTWGTKSGKTFVPGLEYMIDGVEYYQCSNQSVLYKNKDGFWSPVPNQKVAQQRLKKFRTEQYLARKSETSELRARLIAGGAKIDDLIFDPGVDSDGEPLDLQLLDEDALSDLALL